MASCLDAARQQTRFFTWRALNSETLAITREPSFACIGYAGVVILCVCAPVSYERSTVDLSIFATPEAWISLVTLIFLEIVLGIDNLVFISITTNRLPEEKQHIGRKLGLAGALVMRIIFLCFASYLVHMTTPIFTLDFGAYHHGLSIRDLVLLIGGAYLIYKGISEIIDMLRLTEVKAEHSSEHKTLHMITLPQAVATIMVMDLVFSIDSVITAVGMADHLIIMIIAVMVAVVMMMVFIDPISNFINGHPEMKMLALTFIVAIGTLLVLDSIGFHTGIEMLHMPLEKLIVYFAMVFCIVLELIQMRYNKNFMDWKKSRWREQTAEEIETVRQKMLETMEAERKENAGKDKEKDLLSTPIFIGGNVYIMSPVDGESAQSFRNLILESAEAQRSLNAPIEIPYETIQENEASGDASK